MSAGNTPQPIDRESLKICFLQDLKAALLHGDDKITQEVLRLFHENGFHSLLVQQVKKYPLIGAKIYRLICKIGLEIDFFGTEDQIIISEDDQGREFVLCIESSRQKPESIPTPEPTPTTVAPAEPAVFDDEDDTIKESPDTFKDALPAAILAQLDTLASIRDDLQVAATTVPTKPDLALPLDKDTIVNTEPQQARAELELRRISTEFHHYTLESLETLIQDIIAALLSLSEVKEEIREHVTDNDDLTLKIILLESFLRNLFTKNVEDAEHLLGELYKIKVMQPIVQLVRYFEVYSDYIIEILEQIDVDSGSSTSSLRTEFLGPLYGHSVYEYPRYIGYDDDHCMLHAPGIEEILIKILPGTISEDFRNGRFASVRTNLQRLADLGRHTLIWQIFRDEDDPATAAALYRIMQDMGIHEELVEARKQEAEEDETSILSDTAVLQLDFAANIVEVSEIAFIQAHIDTEPEKVATLLEDLFIHSKIAILIKIIDYAESRVELREKLIKILRDLGLVHYIEVEKTYPQAQEHLIYEFRSIEERAAWLENRSHESEEVPVAPVEPESQSLASPERREILEVVVVEDHSQANQEPAPSALVTPSIAASTAVPIPPPSPRNERDSRGRFRLRALLNPTFSSEEKGWLSANGVDFKLAKKYRKKAKRFTPNVQLIKDLIDRSISPDQAKILMSAFNGEELLWLINEEVDLNLALSFRRQFENQLDVGQIKSFIDQNVNDPDLATIIIDSFQDSEAPDQRIRLALAWLPEINVAVHHFELFFAEEIYTIRTITEDLQAEGVAITFDQTVVEAKKRKEKDPQFTPDDMFVFELKEGYLLAESGECETVNYSTGQMAELHGKIMKSGWKPDKR